ARSKPPKMTRMTCSTRSLYLLQASIHTLQINPKPISIINVYGNRRWASIIHDPACQPPYSPASDVHEATPHQAGSPHLPHFRPPSTADPVMAALSRPHLPPAEQPDPASLHGGQHPRSSSSHIRIYGQPPLAARHHALPFEPTVPCQHRLPPDLAVTPAASQAPCEPSDPAAYPTIIAVRPTST
ncbi:hypothetical protein ACLOJK_014625, partial [Asimina triloba]